MSYIKKLNKATIPIFAAISSTSFFYFYNKTRKTESQYFGVDIRNSGGLLWGSADYFWSRFEREDWYG